MSEFQLHEETQSLDRGEAKIVFDLQLPSNQPVEKLLVCVNGFQRPRGDFRAFRKRLASVSPGIATLALDNRGTGESVLRAESVSVQDMARDVEALTALALPALGLKTFSILGISMGGLISQTVALDCPEKVSHLFLVSTTAGSRGEDAPAWLRDPDKAEFKPWPTDDAGMRNRMAPYFGAAFLKKSPLLFDMMIKNMLKRTGDSQMQRGSRLQYQASRGFDGAPKLAQIKAKTLVITGDEDRIMPPENARYLSKHIPAAELREYPGVGHLILIEEPEKFVADVANFLQS